MVRRVVGGRAGKYVLLGLRPYHESQALAKHFNREDVAVLFLGNACHGERVPQELRSCRRGEKRIRGGRVVARGGKRLTK